MRDKKKTLDKKIDNLKFKKIVKKQKLKERGITLIALVVTIIILLILAGVTLNIALSDNGLFNKTKKAAEEYEQAQSEEEDLISQFATQMYSEYIGATVEGYELSSKTVTIDGKTLGLDSNIDDEGKELIGVEEDGSQNFTTEENMKWRIWDYDGNTLRIIGEPTDNLTLKGAAGYNNGVWALDNICNKLYSNGKEGVSATNLKRTDIQKVSTYDYTKYKHDPDGYKEDMTNGDDSSIYFGATKTYEANNKYPALWNENDKHWTYKYEGKTVIGEDKECKIWEAIGTEDGQMGNDMKTGDANTTFQQSYYYHNYKKNEFINDKYYDLIFKKANEDPVDYYWLAGRDVDLKESNCNFGMQNINTTENRFLVTGSWLSSSDR